MLELASQPGTGVLFAVRATDLVGPAAHAALRGGAVDEVFSAVHQSFVLQVIELLLQVGAGRAARVFAAVTDETAIAVLDEVQQCADL